MPELYHTPPLIATAGPIRTLIYTILLKGLR